MILQVKIFSSVSSLYSVYENQNSGKTVYLQTFPTLIYFKHPFCTSRLIFANSTEFFTS